MKVYLGFSGGIDSTYSAVILREKGYDVVGVYHDVTGSNENIEWAKRIADIIKIPLIVEDLQEKFRKTVVFYFEEMYKNGYTPNPCVFCNYYFKFRELLRIAGKDMIATGHYAIIKDDFLYRPVDRKKDQTYFLSRLSAWYLRRIIFPMGEVYKEEAKDFLIKKGIPIKKDSQDLCFMKGDYREYLHFERKEGDIVFNGKIVGKHSGFWHFTIGQRKGIGISHSKPLYVYKIDSKNNRVYVGEEESLYSKDMYAKPVILREYKEDIEVKIRYMHTPSKAEWERKENLWRFVFETPQRSVTPGQWAVVYNGDRVVASSIICK